jgi:phosphoribosylaminoimidazolecarboxamide formyltransferase/IMP cyclohydrolase
VKHHALVSVSDKRGLEELGRGLVQLGFTLVSTGGTARALRNAGLTVIEVSDLTGSPEVMDGRVKTLHPKVFAGVLADLDEPSHREVLQNWQVEPFELVVVNLYPFAAAATKANVTSAELIENIDIGGPSLVRAAAKNHRHVTVIVDPNDYPTVLAALANGGTTLEQRRALAVKAFRHTASYDATIAQTLPHHLDLPTSLLWDALAPHLGGQEIALRYGENPHQQAVFVRPTNATGLAAFQQLQGKELSHNNLMDADGAWRLVHDLAAPGIAIIKHAGPCGVAIGGSAADAYQRALACDPVSAFGGVIASSLVVDEAAANAMTELFAEVIVATEIDRDAREVFGHKKNLRVLVAPPPRAGGLRLRALDGGLLVQSADQGWDESWQLVTTRAPSAAEQNALTLAWRVAKHVASNAIVVADESATLGIGGGQPSRVASCRIAIENARAAGLPLAGSAVGSDAFFPFPDGVELLAKHGVSAIAQPGGSVRDQDVIAAANRLGLAMLFTGRRHFRH